MTESFKNMLYLFGAGATGRDIKINGSELNTDEIRRLAIEQGVWTVVYEPLSRAANAEKYRMEFLSAVSKSIQSKNFTFGILQRLNEKGLKCCIIKGAAVASLYAAPDCRISSDTDILIDPADEQKILGFLAQNGYTVEKREKNDHHAKAYHPVGGLLEIHVRLYSVPTEKLILDGLDLYSEPWRKIEIEGSSFYTLGINDSLMYLTAHYIKHLVNEGGGVRQMMDLLLYIEKNKALIDFEKYNDTLKKLRYDRLIDTVKTVGAKYWGFDYPMPDEILADKILSDSEQGGIFGFGTDERNGFYKAYCKQRHRKSLQSKYILNVKAESGIFRKLFPTKKSMQQLGYNADNPVRLGGAYIHRFYRLLTKGRLKPENKSSSGCGERLELMKELDMID